MASKSLLALFLILAVGLNANSQVMTNVYINKNDDVSKVLSKANKRYIISDNLNLKGKEIRIGSNSILDFQGGSISNGKLIGNKTLVLGAPYCVFSEVELNGTFKGESYPEWFNGDVQKCVNYFKIVRFVDDEYSLNKPLNLQFGCKLQGENFNVLKFNLPKEYAGKGCINVAAFSEVSHFIIYVESDNPAIEIKSGYVSSTFSNSEYHLRIAPETTSPGAGRSATIHIHDLTIRTAQKERQGSPHSTTYSKSPAIWLTGGGGHAAYDKEARMYTILKAPGLWGVKISNIDISGRWMIGIKCEQVNDNVSDDEIKVLENFTKNHESQYNYWKTHNEEIIKKLKQDHKWGYGWITGCVFDNIKIHTALGGIWLGREHQTNGKQISRGLSLQHLVFSNVQMQYWNKKNQDGSVNIGSQYFVKLNYCNGITFTNCEPWDWPLTTKGVERPFQIDDSYNVWNITFQGYSQWNSTTTNFVQYENGANVPQCNEHRVVLNLPEASFGMGNVAILDDYLDYTNYNVNKPETMKCNKQLRLLSPGTYSIPNLNNKIFKEFFKVDIGNNSALSQLVTDAWLEVRLVAEASNGVGTQFRRVITIHYSIKNKQHQLTLLTDEPNDRALKQTDWSVDY